MSDELSFRQHRQRRLTGDEALLPGAEGSRDTQGEAAWELGAATALTGSGGGGGQGPGLEDAPAAERRGTFLDGAEAERWRGEPHAENLGESPWTEPVRAKRPAERATQPLPFPSFPGLGEEEAELGKGKPGGLDLARFTRGIWKRRWLVAGIALAISLGALAIALTLMKHQWSAGVALIMRTHQDQFTLGDGQPYKPQQYNLKTLLDTLKLPSSLQEVIDRTGLEVLPRTLAAAIDVALGKDSNIFHIKVTWNEPRTAANLANQVAEAFVERSRAIRRQDAKETYSSYGAQLAEARTKLRGQNEELLAFREANQVSDFATEVKVLLGDLSRLDAEYKTKLAEVEAMHAGRARLEALIASQPEMVVTSTVYRSPLKQRLADYEWQLQEARSRYTNENPKVIKLEKRVAVLEQMIEESSDQAVPENTYSPNSQRADLDLRLQELIDEIKVREAQVEALDGTTQSMRDKLALLTSKQKEYETLSSRLAASEALEKNLATRVAEARVMMERNESNFDIIEPATPPAEPLASGRKLVVGGGAILGVGAGVFLALLLELLDPFVRSWRDAADATGVELVAEFQKVPAGERRLIDPRRPAEGVAILFRRFINDLESQLEDDDWRSLAVISLEREAGRSLVATNLALSLALKERAVILVDADLRSGAGPRPLDLLDLDRRASGLYHNIRGLAPPAPRDTATPGLRLLEAGDPLPAEDQGLLALGRRQFASLAMGLAGPDRQILFDLPPLSAQETVLEAAAAIGNALLVVRSGQSRRTDINQIVDTLASRGVNLRAVVLTEIPSELMSIKPTFETSPKDGKSRLRWRFKPTQTDQAGAKGHDA